jgi:hypothetical protein
MFDPECQKDTAQGPAEIRKEVHQKVRARQERECAEQNRNDVLNPRRTLFEDAPRHWPLF